MTWCDHIETISLPKPKSKIILGNLEIHITKKFNWFNRLMLRLVFGLDIKNVKENNK